MNTTHSAHTTHPRGEWGLHWHLFRHTLKPQTLLLLCVGIAFMLWAGLFEEHPVILAAAPLLTFTLPVFLYNGAFLSCLPALPFPRVTLANYVYFICVLLPGLLTMAVVLAILAQLPGTYGTFTWGIALDWTLAPVVGMLGCAMALSIGRTEQLHVVPPPGRKLRVWAGVLGVVSVGLFYVFACVPFHGSTFFPGQWSVLSAPPAVVLAASAALGVWGFLGRVRLVGILYHPVRIQGIAPPQVPTGTPRRFQTPLRVLTGMIAFYYLLLAGLLGLIVIALALLGESLETFGWIWMVIVSLIFLSGMLAVWPRQKARALRMLPLRTARAGFALQGLWLFSMMPVLCLYLVLAAVFGAPVIGPLLLLLAMLPWNLGLVLRGGAFSGGMVLVAGAGLGALLPVYVYLPLAAVLYPLGAIRLHRVIANLRPRYVSPLEEFS